MIIIYHANHSIEAHIVAGMLRAHGIDAFTSGDYLQGIAGEIGAQGFSHVMVAEADRDAAQQVISEYERAAD